MLEAAMTLPLGQPIELGVAAKPNWRRMRLNQQNFWGQLSSAMLRGCTLAEDWPPESQPSREGEGWWRRQESDYSTMLILSKLLCFQ